ADAPGFSSPCLVPVLEKLKSNMMPQTLEKKRQYYFDKSEQSHCDETALPIRLTSCIFQRPVTKITSHPGNVVRHHQFCAFRRLLGLQAYSPVGELFRTMDSANVSRIFAQLGVGESLCHVGAWSLHTSPEPILAQFSDGAELDPGLWLFFPHTIYRQPVTEIFIGSLGKSREQGRDWLWPGGQRGFPGRQREPGVLRARFKNRRKSS
uniref:Uncharacterized protein n=1 Tax=Moschus moschiferus TaxID=68415 RepID=A0A8C6D097_MOSMO